MRDSGEEQPHDFDKILESLLDQIRVDFENSANAKARVKFGFDGLDSLVRLSPSKLAVIGGRTSIRKSAFALNLCANASKRGSHVAFFSLEMDPGAIFTRLLSSEAEIDSHRLRIGLYTVSEEQRLKDATNRLSDLPAFLASKLSGIEDIENRARQLSKKFDLDLLIVDYLQLIQAPSAFYSDRIHDTDEIIHALKSLSHELGLPIVVCSQLNLNGEKELNQPPQLTDLPESVVSSADIVMFIHREDFGVSEEQWNLKHPGLSYPRNVADIIVAKNSSGQTGATRLLFRDHLTRFEPIA